MEHAVSANDIAEHFITVLCVSSVWCMVYQYIAACKFDADVLWLCAV